MAAMRAYARRTDLRARACARTCARACPCPLASPVPLREKGDTTRSLGSATLRTTVRFSKRDDGFLVRECRISVIVTGVPSSPGSSNYAHGRRRFCSRFLAVVKMELRRRTRRDRQVPKIFFKLSASVAENRSYEIRREREAARRRHGFEAGIKDPCPATESFQHFLCLSSEGRYCSVLKNKAREYRELSAGI